MSLPSSLVRQRPDIRSAEELLHAASAAVGVATANLYPQVTLSGQYGTAATRVGDLFGPGSAVWGIGAGLLQPIFHGGALRATRRAEVAGFDQAAAQYRETVLQAFREVADVLRALEYDAVTLKAQSDAEAAARDTLDIATKQVRLRRDELPLPARRAASVPPGADPPGPGAGAAVRRHRRAVPGARGRVVEP